MEKTITRTITMSEENWEHCKNIADEIEELVDGNFVNVDGEAVEVLEDEDGEYIMVDGERQNAEDFDQYTLYDYFNDVFDIKYTVDANLEYCGVRLMVACGGPNIYVDTMTKKVQLYWWSDYAEYELASEAVSAIDDIFEDHYNCIR